MARGRLPVLVIAALILLSGCMLNDDAEIILVTLPERESQALELTAAVPEARVEKSPAILRGGWRYELLPREDLPEAYPYKEKVACLVRRKDVQKEVLDNRAALGYPLIEAGDKAVYRRFETLETEDVLDEPLIASRDWDGKGLRTYSTLRGVCGNLCYDGGFLYYGGYKKSALELTPLNRLRPDLTKDLNMARIDGWFLIAIDGWGYYITSDGSLIKRAALDWSGRTEDYRACELGGCEPENAVRTKTGFTVELKRGGEIMWHDVDV